MAAKKRGTTTAPIQNVSNETVPIIALETTSEVAPEVTPKVTPQVYCAMQDVFLHLKVTESWRGKIPTQEGFSKEDKEALNLMVLAIMKDVWSPDGVNWEGFLPYVMLRLIRKRFTWDSKPANKKDFTKKIPGFEDKLNEYAVGKMEEEGAGDFARYALEAAKKVDPKTLRLYKAARTFATLVEYEEMRHRLRPDITETTRGEIREDIKNFFDLPKYYELVEGIGDMGKLKQLIRTISCARYTFRWQSHISNIRCNILTHMLESAALSYIQNLEEGVSSTETLMKDFWIMLFHDIAEVWSDDIPGPVKDSFTVKWKGEEVKFRHITEIQEGEAEEINFIANLADVSKEFFRKHMLDAEKDPAKHKRYKNFDYFAADWEVYWNILAGAREPRYFEILYNSLAFQPTRTDIQKKAIIDFLKSVN